MVKWLRALFTEFVVNLLIGAWGVGVLIIVWLAQVPIYILLLVTLGSFGLVFLAINQFHTFQERRKKGLAELGDREIDGAIRDWLDDPIFKFQRKVSPNYLFQFVVTDEAGRPITIGRPELKPTQLELATAITLGEKHRQKYETLSSYEREKVLHTLRIEMARYGIGYSGIHSKLERVVLSDIVLLDNSLTEFYLKQRIFYVTGAFALYKEVIGVALSEQGSNNEGSRTE